MPRPTAGETPTGAPLSPYATPPNGMAMPGAMPAPLSYAGQPVPPIPSAKAVPTPAGLFNAFRRRWVLGTFVGLLVAATAAVSLWLALPSGKHEARALVNLRERTTELAGAGGDYESYRREQVFILKTRDLLTRTANDPSVISLGMMKGTDDPVRLLEESLSVSAAAPSILAVTLRGDNIDEMKIIVDALVKRYVDDATAAGRRSREDQRKKLERLEQTLKDEAEAVERQMKLIATTGATGGESSEKKLAALQTRISTLEADIDQLHKEFSKMEVDRNIAKKQLDAGRPPLDPTLLKLAVDANSEIIGLKIARDKVAAAVKNAEEVATDPTNDSTVNELKGLLQKAEQSLERRKKEVGAELEETERIKGLLRLKEKIADLETNLAKNAEYRERFKFDRDTLSKTISGNAVGSQEINNLLQGLIPQREAIAKIRTQLVQLRLQQSLDNNENVREFAQSLPNNNLTKKLVVSGGAFLGTFAVVVLLVAFLEWRTRRVDGVDQVVDELGMRIIGTVPAFPNRASLRAAAEAGGANWRFALNEAINSTRTMLLHSARAQSMQVVMVTSATQGEGKTSLASQLASSMATAGMRTLIVDCDLRNPSIHKLFELGVGPGVSEILVGDVDASDAVQPTAVPNLWVIPAGTCSNRVIAALAQGHPLETLFNRLRGQFDFVIVDSCPVLPVADALLVGQHVDGVVFSIMQDISQLPKVLLASEKLTQLNIPLVGAVVNGIKQDVYSYGYNYVKQLPA